MKTRILLTISLAILSAQIAAAQSWKYIAPMKHARAQHKAVLLKNGRIMVMGGENGTDVLSSCEIYDPRTDTWQDVASMHEPRLRFTAFVLDDGRVFVAGGLTVLGVNITPTSKTCEIYDPSIDKWTYTASMSVPREIQEDCMIDSGRIALIGGLDANTADYVNSADLYSPSTGTMIALSNMPASVAFSSCVYSPEAKAIFVLGGNQAGYGGFKSKTTQKFSIAEMKWSLVDSMIDRQGAHFNSLRYPKSGDIFVFTNDTGYKLKLTHRVEALNPMTGHWRDAGVIIPRSDPHATLIEDSVILIGGVDSNGNGMQSTTWYSFLNEKSYEGPPLLEPVMANITIYAKTQLPGSCVTSRKIYVLGGKATGYPYQNSNYALNDCEILDLGDLSSPSSLACSLHRSIASSYFVRPDSLSMLVDVNSSINLDSLWPDLQQMAGTYSWDSSVVRFDGYVAPAGWITSSMTSHGNSVNFTIDNISSTATQPLSLGTAIFLPKAQTLTATEVKLQDLTLQVGNQVLSPCVNSNEDQHWAVKVLGLEGVESSSEESGFSIDWTRIENGKLSIGYHSPEYSPDIRFELYDELGRCLKTSFASTSNVSTIDLVTLCSGNYFLRVVADGISASRLITLKR